MNTELKAFVDELPKTCAIADCKYEASHVVLYTKSREFFVENDQLVKQLVAKLKKRIEVRPDPTITLDPEIAKDKIKAIIPKDAELQDVIFQLDMGVVLIQAGKPGVVVGRGAETIDQIKRETFWYPVILRVPAISSKFVDKARELTTGNPGFRKKYLNKIGEKIRLNKVSSSEWVRITALGGYRQIGRSCTLVSTENSNVMLDCGIDPSSSGKNAYPYLGVPEIDLQNLDAVIISHAHTDHVGFLPYLFKYGYEGPVYCTEPTRDLMILLLLDALDINKAEGRDMLYSAADIKKMVEHSITVPLNEVNDITPDLRLTLHNAGHILGSAAVHLHVGEGLHNIVYTGDYKFGRTELLNPADPYFARVETLITESTYGANKEPTPNRQKVSERFFSLIEKTLARGGKMIIPSFAVGRAQEVMVTLAQNPKLVADVPVYLDGQIWDATALHTAYPEFLHRNLQKKIFQNDENPFLLDSFSRIGGMKEREQAMEQGPAVILTTSGMMVGGPVLSYLERLSGDEKNMLGFVGYQATGTLGGKIARGWRKVQIGKSNKITELKLQIESVQGFSAHSDRQQIVSYVGKLRNKPSKIICVHGDESAPFQMASLLHNIYRTETLVPQNLETIRLV